jgi:23S rRNA (pseudouridine1915-N3)-methyltransferase
VKLAFVFVGGHKEPWLSEFTGEYLKKIGYFCPCEIVRIKPSRQARASAEQKLAEETDAILRALKKDDIVIICDERGDAPSSKKFSDKLVKFFERGRPRVVFLIGGAFGFGNEIRERADWTWSLSSMVLNHHVAQAVVLEQVYRAFTIWKNIPYHNE